MRIKQVIIPAAGYGTRFLPYTKAVCKELVPLIDTPIIHHIVQEAIASGCTSVNLVINEHKNAIKSYFQHDNAIAAIAKHSHKEHVMADIDRLLNNASFNFFYQREQYGVAHALMQALPALHAEFFGIMYPDDIIFSDTPALQQCAELALEKRATVIAVTEVPTERISAYGIIKPKAWLSDDVCLVDDIIEKPSIEQAPSRLALIGRFVVAPSIVPAMHQCVARDGETFLFTDALTYLARTEGVYAYRIKGTRHDTGTPEGWVTAVVDYALRSDRYSSSVVHGINAYKAIDYSSNPLHEALGSVNTVNNSYR